MCPASSITFHGVVLSTCYHPFHDFQFHAFWAQYSIPHSNWKTVGQVLKIPDNSNPTAPAIALLWSRLPAY